MFARIFRTRDMHPDSRQHTTQFSLYTDRTDFHIDAQPTEKPDQHFFGSDLDVKNAQNTALSRYMSNQNKLGWGVGFGLFTIFIFRLLIYRESARNTFAMTRLNNTAILLQNHQDGMRCKICVPG